MVIVSFMVMLNFLAEIDQDCDLECANQWPLGHEKGKETTD